MTELSFLVDLLVNHKLAKVTKDAVVARIKEVESRCSSSSPTSRPAATSPQSASLPPHIAAQVPSMQAIMMRNQDLVPTSAQEIPVATSAQVPESQPVAVIAQTPAAVAAVNARERSIRQAMSGKPMPGETKPRKF